MTGEQIEVFDLLQGLSTQKKHFHKWYQGALELINSQSPDKIAQAAHSLRELCDELPTAIAQIPKFANPISAVKSFGSHFFEVKAQSYSGGWKGNTINQPLDELLLRFEKIFSEPARSKRLARALTATDPQANVPSKDWQRERDKVFEDLYGFFQNVAHHNSSPAEAILKEKLKLFEALLLNYLTPCTAAQQKELLALMAAPPNEETYARVSELILHKTANFHFFFNKLNNTNWLLFLDQKGLFQKLPGPEPTDNGGIIYRHHLPLMVLARLAGTDPKIVTGILIQMQLPDNPYVGDQILQCIAKIPDPDCIKQLNPLIVQLGEDSARTSWLWIQELLKSWTALKVFPEIFAVLRAYLNSAVEQLVRQDHGVHGVWSVKEVDRKFLDDLMVQYPAETGDLLFHALSRWFDLECKKNKQDITYGALRSHFIEDFKSTPPEYLGVEATLAKRLFSAAQQLYLRDDFAAIGKLDKLLRSSPWHLFRRLRWQLYADFPKCTLDQARAEVLQKIPFLHEIDYCRGSHDYEFAQLLVAHVKCHGDAFLSRDEVERFAATVMKGPMDSEGKLLEGDNDFFYRKQLWPISPLLRGAQLAAYRDLVPDDGKIRIESFKPHSFGGVSGGFVASKAPKEAEALGLMKDEELWNFLNTWESKGVYEYDSTGGLHHENIGALAEKFADLVESAPERFNPDSQWWEHINREEIFHKLLDKAADRVSKNQKDEKTVASSPTESEWGNWFGITHWMMEQSWPRHAASRFLRNALKSDHVMPDYYFLQFPELLRRLIEGTDTRLLGGKNSFGDWLTTAINSVRGVAIEALLNLALRQKNAGKSIEPWIFELIRSRLELVEESPAIFAFLGTNLRFLIHLFKQELNESLSLLFPRDRPEHLSAAITAHFKYDQPSNAIIEMFPEFIKIALDTLQANLVDEKDEDAKQNRRDFASRLGTHIACYYWSGSFANDAEGEAALDRFFDVASKSVRGMLINEIARIWEQHNDKPLDEKTMHRVLRIWERRWTLIEEKLKGDNSASSEYDSELSESTDWLNCECFPFEWRFTHAKLALRRLKRAPRAYRLLETIVEFGKQPDRLEPMLELLKILLLRPSDELRWSIQPEKLKPIISSGLASDKSTTKKLAEECKDLILKMGFSDFLDL